jgi:thiol-disulfide isomerase/thioredoxin
MQDVGSIHSAHTQCPAMTTQSSQSNNTVSMEIDHSVSPIEAEADDTFQPNESEIPTYEELLADMMPHLEPDEPPKNLATVLSLIETQGFRIEDQKGVEQKLTEEQKSGWVLLHYTAPQCLPCRRLTSLMILDHQKHDDKSKSFTVIVMSGETGAEFKDHLIESTSTLGVSTSAELATALGIRGFPSLEFFINGVEDPSLSVRFRHHLCQQRDLV